MRYFYSFAVVLCVSLVFGCSEEVLEDSGLRVDVQVTRRVAAHVALGVRRVQVRRQQQVAAPVGRAVAPREFAHVLD